MLDFSQIPDKLLINGEWTPSESGQIFSTLNPANGEVLAHVSKGETADIHRAVLAAREAFDHGPWSKITASERAKLLWKLADLLQKNADQFAELESLDNGKPVNIAKIVDVMGSVETFRYMSGWCSKIGGDTFPISVGGTRTQYLTYTVKEPVGVVGQIIPWNFPLLMATFKLAPALAAGCTMVLKPAEQTPLTALLLGQLIMEAGFPKGVVNIVTGFGDAGAALVAHPLVDKVTFTGSTEVGKRIVQGAAGDLKRVSLELGGKSANIIFADADLKAAIATAANAIYFNQGQTCTAGSRLYVEESVFEQVVEGVKQAAEKIPEAEAPLVSQEQLDRVCAYIRSGVDEGACIVTGGTTLNRPGYFLRPTLMTNVNGNMKIVQEEIFGPVLIAKSFKDVQEVIREANDSEYGLAAGIWTRDIAKAHAVSAKLRTGTTWINCYNIFDPALTFGGYKQSGWGREMGKAGVEAYLETKSVCLPLGKL